MSENCVYVVDDDDSVRRSVGFMLKTTGHSVQSFSNGTEFLKKVKTLEPGCVLLDIRMPEIDGLEVQASLNDRGIPHPVVLMTGHGDIQLAVQAMKAGAVDFIEKPFDKDVMLDAVQEAFSQIRNAGERSERRDDARKRLNCLTSREEEVLQGLVKGYPNKTIGYDLGISARTVEIHRAKVMAKIDVSSLSDLLRIAFAAGVGDAQQ